MAASISLSGLSWSTPDGTPLFTDLTLAFGPQRTGIVGRNGTGKSTLLRLIAGELRPAAGRLQVSGTVALLRQEAMGQPDPIPNETIADLFGLGTALNLLDRAEAGLATLDELAEADWTIPSRVEGALLRCGLSACPKTPLAALSGGQRSRAALAARVFAAPDFLLLDEPTNNLDQEGRQAVLDLLHGWTGGAIIVSHDRALLDKMEAIVEFTSLGATRYGGNYTAYRHSKQAELEAAAEDLAHAEKSRADTARRAQLASERKARKDSAGQRSRAKAGQPKILLDAAKARAEASAGASLRLREARREVAEAALSAARAKIEVLQPLRMEIPPTGLQANRPVLRINGLSGGYAPDRPVIRDLSLSLTGPERLVISGPNGSGKTTLLRLITGDLAPHSGEVTLSVPYALLDQHLGLLDPSQSLLANFLRLNPAAETHGGHAALARFGFRAADALRLAATLSGGQRLRAGLACTLGADPPPMLLILDEPTNHLDLDAITALETALAAYDGAVLLISHDPAFLAAFAADRTLVLGE